MHTALLLDKFMELWLTTAAFEHKNRAYFLSGGREKNSLDLFAILTAVFSPNKSKEEDSVLQIHWPLKCRGFGTQIFV